jgi:hypothetical protein
MTVMQNTESSNMEHNSVCSEKLSAKRDGYSMTVIQNTETSNMKHNSVCTGKIVVRSEMVTT